MRILFAAAVDSYRVMEQMVNEGGMLPLGHVIVLPGVPEMNGMMTAAPLPAPAPNVTPLIVAWRLLELRSRRVVDVALAALYHPQGTGRGNDHPVSMNIAPPP